MGPEAATSYCSLLTLSRGEPRLVTPPGLPSSRPPALGSGRVDAKTAGTATSATAAAAAAALAALFRTEAGLCDSSLGGDFKALYIYAARGFLAARRGPERGPPAL